MHSFMVQSLVYQTPQYNASPLFVIKTIKTEGVYRTNTASLLETCLCLHRCRGRFNACIPKRIHHLTVQTGSFILLCDATISGYYCLLFNKSHLLFGQRLHSQQLRTKENSREYQINASGSLLLFAFTDMTSHLISFTKVTFAGCTSSNSTVFIQTEAFSVTDSQLSNCARSIGAVQISYYSQGTSSQRHFINFNCTSPVSAGAINN